MKTIWIPFGKCSVGMNKNYRKKNYIYMYIYVGMYMMYMTVYSVINGIPESFGLFCISWYLLSRNCLMPLGLIQARAFPNLSDELFWVQDLNFNFRSLMPEARTCSLLSPFWEPFWLCFICSWPNKPAKGAGRHAIFMKNLAEEADAQPCPYSQTCETSLHCFHGNRVFLTCISEEWLFL